MPDALWSSLCRLLISSIRWLLLNCHRRYSAIPVEETMKKKISPKTVVTVIAVLMVLGGGIVLLHSPISPIQENSTHKIYMSPDRDPSLGKQTIDSQEKPPALRDSPELENQAQASPSIDSNSTSTGEPKITSQSNRGNVGRANTGAGR